MATCNAESETTNQWAADNSQLSFLSSVAWEQPWLGGNAGTMDLKTQGAIQTQVGSKPIHNSSLKTTMHWLEIDS